MWFFPTDYVFLTPCTPGASFLANPNQNSVVLEPSAKPCLGCGNGSQGLVWQKIQEPLTPDENLLGVAGVKSLAHVNPLQHTEHMCGFS